MLREKLDTIQKLGDAILNALTVECELSIMREIENSEYLLLKIQRVIMY